MARAGSRIGICQRMMDASRHDVGGGCRWGDSVRSPPHDQAVAESVDEYILRTN